MVKKGAELTPEEIIEGIREENLYLGDHGVDMANIIRQKEFYKGRAIQLQSNFSEANQKIRMLAHEVSKRNNNLKILSDAYTDLKSASSIDKDKIGRVSQDIVGKAAKIDELIITIEKYKKQIMKGNIYLESLFKKLTDAEHKIKEKDILNSKFRAENNNLMKNLKIKDIALIKAEENMNKAMIEYKARTRIDFEREMERICQKEKFMRKKVVHLNQKIMEKDRMIFGMEKKLSDAINLHRMIKEFIESAPAEIPKRKKIALLAKRMSRIPSLKAQSEALPEEVPEEVLEVIPEKALKKVPKKVPKKTSKEVSKKAYKKTYKKVYEPVEEIHEIIKAPFKEAEKEGQEIVEEPTYTETLPDKAEDIVPIVKIAKEHGDTEDRIRSSLISSGYDPKEVDKAIKK